ncbi:MAG: hypothetical protein AAFY99_00310 [Pseudomonadota bacterium]
MSSAEAPRPQYGLVGFILGLVAMILVSIQLSDGSDQPIEQVTQTTEQTSPEDQPKSGNGAADTLNASKSSTSIVSHILMVGSTVLAGMGAVAGGVGVYRDEPRKLPMVAIGIGVGAILLQYIFWQAVAIAVIGLIIYFILSIHGVL